jgi:hypothetical protein
MLEKQDVCRSTLESDPNGGSNRSICSIGYRRWQGERRINRYAFRTINLILKSGRAQRGAGKKCTRILTELT